MARRRVSDKQRAAAMRAAQKKWAKKNPSRLAALMRKHYLEKTKPRRQIRSFRLRVSKNVSRLLAGKDVRPLVPVSRRRTTRVKIVGGIILSI